MVRKRFQRLNEPVVLAEIEYVLDSPCMVPLEKCSLVAPARYVEVTPLTVALRLMEDRVDGLKEVGVIRSAHQLVERDVLRHSDFGRSNFLPGTQTVKLCLVAQMFLDVRETDFSEIRPDVPLSDFCGHVTNCMKRVEYQ